LKYIFILHSFTNYIENAPLLIGSSKVILLVHIMNTFRDFLPFLKQPWFTPFQKSMLLL